MYVNLKKCEFVIDQIEFLNFIVFIENIQMNSKKIRIIQKWSRFKNYRKLQMFLKFVNYYRRFIHKYFKLIAFFIDLLKNNEKNKKFEFFIWKKVNQNKRFARFVTNLHRFSFFIILIQLRKSNWKSIFRISKLQIFLINRMKKIIHVR